MANPFIWYELLTSDHKAASDFYRAAMGWDITPWQTKAGGEAMPYLMFGNGGAMTGGMMDLPPPARANGAPPHWGAYVMVPDTDAAAAKAASLGGTVMVPPTDIPDVGRFAVITDPQGAFINVMTPLPMDPPPPSPPEGVPGRCGWNELFTTDQAGALAFYAAMFGWEKVRGHDMGPMGVYEILTIDGKELIGTMTLPPQMPRPHWNFYFIVDDIQAAAARTTANGGSIVMGPMEVPGGSWVFQGRDPQGAYFGALKPAA